MSDGQELRGQHVLETRRVGVGPAFVAVANDFGRAGQDVAGPGGLDLAVVVGMAAGKGGGPGVHDLDGVLRVGLVAGDVPEQRLAVGGFAVGLLVLAAEVGVGIGAALDGFAGMRSVIERAPAAGFRASKAVFCGSMPAATRRLISSNCARLTRTPG